MRKRTAFVRGQAAGFALALATLAATPAARAAPAQQEGDAYTRYELLAPGSGTFRITYDVTVFTPGGTAFFNPIRPGSVSTDERVTDRATGEPLKFEVVDGATAKAAGLDDAKPSDQFIRVTLARPVPADGGQGRILIEKTYADAKSYFVRGDEIVFKRGLGIKHNAVLLPEGYELVACNTPSQVIQQKDGRILVSFLNYTAAEAPLELHARKTLGKAAAAAPSAADKLDERAAQTRDIVYFLKQPETHAFSLYHDYTETRPGVADYVNVVREGSTVSDPSGRNLDTGEALGVEVLKGAEITAKGVKEPGLEHPSAGTEAVVFRFPAVQPHHSARLRMSETYTDLDRYKVVGDELVWDRALGRAVNAVVLPDGWALTHVSVPATVSTLPDGRVRVDLINPVPGDLAVLITARRR
jgi:hypothetical protein